MNTDNTPENKKQDDAVLSAFSKSYDSDNEFRERWKATVAQAEKRREERRIQAEEKQKQEEERKARLARELNPRVTNEVYPGKPLDIKKLAEIAAEKKAAIIPEEPEIPETAVFHEPEPESFVFDTEKALTEEANGNISSAEVPLKSIRDRRLKKKLKEKLHFTLKTKFSKDGVRRFVKRNIPVKGDDSSEIVRKCIRGASLIALICAFVYLGNYFVDYCQRVNLTSSLEEEMNDLADIEDEDLEAAWEQIKAQYPDVDFPEGMNIKFSELYAINQNVVGWLKIDNTNISTVLLQADNNTYHLRMNIYNEYSRFGNPFVHYKCSMGKEGLSKNTILFGHNANDGLMFHDLINYMTVEGYKKAPIVTLDTLYEQTKWKIFAVVLTTCSAKEDNGTVWQYLYTDFSSDESFNQLLTEIDERNIIHTGVDVETDDKILTLYTCCTYQLAGGRLVIFARQLRDGESEEIDTSKIYYNQNARYPQAWYDKKGKVNPYAETTAATTTNSSASTTKKSETTTKKSETTTKKEETTTVQQQTTQKAVENGTQPPSTTVPVTEAVSNGTAA